jgi:hypothetical protein
MVAERRVSSAEVERYVRDIPREISELEKRLVLLRGSAEAMAVAPDRNRRDRRVARRPTRRAAAGQRLHGSYVGYIRQIPEQQRSRYTAIRKKKGVEAAIAAMKRMLGK